MDFGGLLVLGIVWLLFNLIGQGKGRARTAPPQPTPRAPADRHRRSRPSGKAAGWSDCSASWSGASRRSADRQSGGGSRLPTPQRPTRPRLPPMTEEEEDVEERDSLEEPEQVVSLEMDVPRRERAGVRPGHRGRGDRAAADRGGARPGSRAGQGGSQGIRCQDSPGGGGSHGGAAVHARAAPGCDRVAGDSRAAGVGAGAVRDLSP